MILFLISNCSVYSARAIRKAALTCLLRRCRCFAHIQALNTSVCQSTDPYASINLLTDARWLNYYLNTLGVPFSSSFLRMSAGSANFARKIIAAIMYGL